MYEITEYYKLLNDFLLKIHVIRLFQEHREVMYTTKEPLMTTCKIVLKLNPGKENELANVIESVGGSLFFPFKVDLFSGATKRRYTSESDNVRANINESDSSVSDEDE